MKYLSIVLMIYASQSFCKEASEAFIVKLYNTSIRVISPDHFVESISVIVENKSTSKMIGKLVREKGEVVNFFSLLPEEHGAVETKITKEQRLFYVPVSPAFQTIELLFGKDAYEIPPKL